MDPRDSRGKKNGFGNAETHGAEVDDRRDIVETYKLGGKGRRAPYQGFIDELSVASLMRSIPPRRTYEAV